MGGPMLRYGMSGYALDEALRLWLNQKVEGEHRIKTRVAQAMGLTPERFHHWLTGRNKVPLHHLTTLARYFGLSDEAAMLVEIRRLYPPPTAPERLESAETPALVSQFVRDVDAATAPRQRRLPGRRAAAHKTRGTR